MTEGTDAYDIFLSYARLDNERETDDKAEAGWVDHFHARLIKQLRRRGRPDIGFWRDVAEIDGADRFAPEIIKGLAQSHFFLPVLSPNYVHRPWCQEEVKLFASRRAKEPAIDGRIVPVYKRPVEKHFIPELLSGRGGYHFYEQDPVSKSVIEYFRRGRVENEDAFAELLDQIADHICANLPAAAPHAEVQNPAAAPNVVTVFVAKVADDMYPAYDKVVTELKTQGIRVVMEPELELPHDRAAAEAAVADALHGAKLAVHLLGHEPGPLIGDKWLTDLLLDQTHAGTVPRLIWAPSTLFDDPTRPEASVRKRDRDPLAILGVFGEFRDGDSVSGEPFEAFLQDLVRRCQSLLPPTGAGPRAAIAEAARVYVVGALDDASLVHQVAGTLIDDHGLNANPCAFEGAPDEKRRLHEDEMRDSDAVLYCWGKATDAWLRSYTRETRSAARFGRERPFRATALFPGPPLSDHKRSFRAGDLSLHLPAAETVTPELFTRLVEALQ